MTDPAIKQFTDASPSNNVPALSSQKTDNGLTLDESIEYTFANQLSISALDLSLKESDCCSIKEEDRYHREIGKFQLRSKPTNVKRESRREKPMSTFQSGSTSLFDLFSSSSAQPIQRINIRDVLESSESQLLENCSTANVEDLIMGFNTTELEIEQLGLLIFKNLVNESSSIIYDAENMEKSYLDLHVKWIKDSVNVEECHSFAYVLLRNVILSLQCDRVVKNKDHMVSCALNMLKEYFKMWNDDVQFQMSSIQIIYFIVEIFFKPSQSKDDIYSALALHDVDGKYLSRLLSCLSSSVILRRVVIKTKMIESLYSIVSSKILSITDRNSILGAKDVSQRDLYGKVLEYSFDLIHYILSNTQLIHLPSSFMTSYNYNDCQNTHELTFEHGLTFQRDVEDCKEMFDANEKKVSQDDVEYLLKPFFNLLDMGLQTELSYLFPAKMIHIATDSIVQTITSVYNLSNFSLLQNVLDKLEQLLTKITNLCNDEGSRCVVFDVDGSNFVRLSSTPSCLLKVYKGMFVHVSLQSESLCRGHLERHMKMVVQCLNTCLISSQQIGKVDVPLWNDVVSILLLFVSTEQHHMQLKEMMIPFSIDYEKKTSHQCCCVETMMLTYCILFELKEVAQTDQHKTRFVGKIKNHCFGRYFLSNTSIMKEANCLHYDSLLAIFYPHLLKKNTGQSTSIRKWVKELMLAKILKDEISAIIKNIK